MRNRRAIHAMNTARGFTLLELLVAMAIAALIASFAIPSLRDFVRSNAVAAAANQMVSLLNTARTQSVTQRRYAAVCRSSNYASYGPNLTGTTTSACDTASGSTGSDGYEDGILVWMTDNPSATQPSSMADIVKAQAVDVSGGITIRGDGNAVNLVVFQPTGVTRAAGNLVVCSAKDWNGSGNWKNGGANSVVIQISSGGRVQSVAGDKQVGTSISKCAP